MSDYFGNITISEEPKRKQKPTRPGKSVKPGKKKPVARKKPAKKRKEIRWDRFFLISTLIITTLLTTYAAIGFFLVPKLLKTNLIEKVQYSTGLDMTIGRIAFNPFSFRAQLQDILVKEPQSAAGKPPLLQLDHFDINLELTSLLRSRLVCSHMNIDRFRLVITRDKEKQYNFSKLYSDSDESGNSDIIEFSKLPFLFSFNNIVAREGEIILNDHFSSKRHRVEQIKLSLPNLANFTHSVAPSVQPRFSAIINGSPIELRGENNQPIATDPTDSQTKLSCDISSLDLPLYFDYLPASIPLSLTKGTADGILQLSFTLGKNKGRQFTVDFDIVTTEIELQSVDKTLSIQAPKVELKGSIQPFTGDLHLEEFLIQEPVINVEKSFSQLSLVKLLPFLQTNSPKSRFVQKKQELSINKLMFDNGTVHVQKEGTVKTWNSVLFNLNHFTNNAKDTTNTTGAGSFSLNAEVAKDGTSFSWKGTLDQSGRMAGDINISSLPASAFFSFLGVNPTGKTSGNCDIQGQFSLAKGLKKSSPVSYSLKKGTISVNNLHLTHNGREWLHAPKLKLVSFESTDNHYDLGNMFIENGTVTVHNNKLPALLTVFSNNKQYGLHGIDFSGNMTIQGNTNQQQPLKLTNLRFQANNLDHQKSGKGNFGLSAGVGKKGELKAQGTLSLQPFKGSFDISFSRLPFSQIAGYYTDAPHIIGARASMRGQGKLSFPGGAYTGSLGVDRAEFRQKKGNSRFSWSKGTIGDFLIKQSPFQLKMDDITVANLQLEENKQRWLTAKTLQTDGISKEKDQLHLGNIRVKQGSVTLSENKFPEMIDSWLTRQQTTTRVSSINYTGSLTIKPENQAFEQLQLTHMHLKADKLDKAAGATDNVTLTTKVNSKGSFEAKGDLSFTPLTTSLTCDFSTIESKHIFPWLTESKLLLESQALLSGKGKLSYPKNHFSGFLKIADARIRKNPDKLLLSWRTADIFKLNIELDPLRISSTKVNVNKPGFGWSRTRSSGNVYQQAHSFLADILAQDLSTSGANKPASLEIAKITIKNGSAQYFDKRLNPAWHANISNINGTLKTIQTDNPDAETRFNLAASLAGSPVTLMGSTRLFAPKTNGNALVKVTTVPVGLFDEQISPLLKLDTGLGIFDLVMNSKWIDGRKSGSAHFTFLSLTATSGDADTAVPLALLSDHKNTFQLYVPLDGNEQQPARSLFNETVNNFQTKLIKAKYSPILLAGHNFSNLVNIDNVQCVSGKTTITDHGRSVMGRYSDLAKIHPKLQLEIIGMADPTQDNTLLKKELATKELARVREENKRREAKRRKREEDSLRRQKKMATTQRKDTFAESDLPLKQPDNLAPISAKPVTVSDAALRKLAKNRAHTVYDQFIAVNGLTPEQLLLSEDVRINQDASHVLIKLTARP